MTEHPATYADVFAVKEYRYLFSAYVLSLAGDHLTAVTVAYFVYTGTGSAALAATGYASSYLAWLVGGPLLSGLADRFSRRQVLLGCDLARGLLIALAALPGLPAPALVALLFVVNLLRAPFMAARAALMPEVLDGDRYPVANGVDHTAAQVVQVVGFAVGGGLAVVLSLSGALLIDAATYLSSALLIWVGVRRARSTRPGTWQAAGSGASTMRVLLGDQRLRAYLLVLWVASAFTYAGEGLMAPLALQYGGQAGTVGLLLAAAPLGTAVGAVALTRSCPPGRRARLILPLAVLSAAALAALALEPPIWVVLGLLAMAGAGSAFAVPLNSLFGTAVPAEFRARAFGIAMTGLSGLQGGAMVLAGLAADRWSPTTVVGACGLLGAVAVFALTPFWPDRRSAPIHASLEQSRTTSTIARGSTEPSQGPM